MALVAKLSPADQRGRYQGAYGMSWGLAGALAPIGGSSVLERLGAASLWGSCFLLGGFAAAGHLALRRAWRQRSADLPIIEAPI
jgi:MFS family permease